MARFITSNELNSELEKLFETAEQQLILISPFIKLHERYASALSLKKENPQLQITVVFGKNEDDLKKSMSEEDLNFFTQFANVEIRYEKRLHAKYYANERWAILTSMNLYKYSQDNNIESGILTSASSDPTKVDVKSASTDNLYLEAYHYFERVVEQSNLIFKKIPRYDKGKLRTGLNKKYIGSKVEVDKIKEAFKTIFLYKSRSTVFTENVTRKIETAATMGFCIRTGIPILFNPYQPLCEEAYDTWKAWGNADFPEQYCHFSGEESRGETTYANPILARYRDKAKEMFSGMARF